MEERQMRYPNMNIRVDLGEGQTFTCTLAEFARDNAGDMPADADEIALHLMHNDEFVCGGGAAPECVISHA